jgi:hypothetical protein
MTVKRNAHKSDGPVGAKKSAGNALFAAWTVFVNVLLLVARIGQAWGVR